MLVGHDPFVGHGAQWLHVELAGQMHIAGADEASGEIVLEHVHHFFLHAVGEASTGAEVGDLQMREFIGAGIGA
ncbi:hypothetical protein D3C85_741820 [compost metagenome]